MNYLVISFIIMHWLFYCLPAIAAVKVTELYPAPSSGEFEWVELHNDEDTSIDITGYSIVDSKDNKILLTDTVILPMGFILATSAGVLNNTGGDSIIIKNNNGETADTVTYTDDFTGTKSYARCSTEWISTAVITKNQTNESACNPTPTPTPTSLPATEMKSSIDNIFISEAYVYPDAGEHEWIELFNNNEFSVSLSRWFIDDKANEGAQPREFSLDIPAKNFSIIDLSSSVFNNDSDQVRLLDPQMNIKDVISYAASQKTKSIGKVDFDDARVCIQNPSIKGTNNSCLFDEKEFSVGPSPTDPPTPTPSRTPTKLPTVKISPKITTVKRNYKIGTHSALTLDVTAPVSPAKGKATVLGTSDKKPGQKKFDAVNITGALAIFFTILTIISVLSKIKK